MLDWACSKPRIGRLAQNSFNRQEPSEKKAADNLTLTTQDRCSIASLQPEPWTVSTIVFA